ncbi:Uma2 family endonuclease [Actinospica sp.]|uniref:Uma2 family endonuclease n=1 Tax=Actinospica sp. TaxID=1872142 RepID=UPI002C741F6E|nr:Uma2 family endonuclease [Actinospica sp.]HWG28237.1 Uma2 family endonuclease [Actinospica sp.]
MSLAPVPEWMFPPEGGFTAEDLDRLPDLPPHTELIDASLVLVSPQAYFHSLAIDMLVAALRRTVPSDLLVSREMTVTLDWDQRPEPDIVVIHATALRDEDQTTFVRGDVVLAVEVVSPESRSRDRKRKPVLYAEAGIEHFWRIEREQGERVLYAYRLDSSKRAYKETGRYVGSAQLSVPYPIEIDFSELAR